jgi:hypothetical protein
LEDENYWGIIEGVYEENIGMHITVYRMLVFDNFLDALQSHMVRLYNSETHYFYLILRRNIAREYEVHEILKENIKRLHRITESKYFLAIEYPYDIENISVLSDEEKSDIYTQHTAVLTARERNIDILIVPINLFSDETSGNLSNRLSKYENVSYTISNIPFKLHLNSRLSTILSTSDGVSPIEMINVICRELNEMESGIFGLDGLTKKGCIIIVVLNTVVGDNPRQSEICNMKGVTAGLTAENVLDYAKML